MAAKVKKKNEKFKHVLSAVLFRAAGLIPEGIMKVKRRGRV